MEKRKITRAQFNFLEEELEYLKKENLITLDQKNDILDKYTMKMLNFIKIILVIGSVLIGLGILSFIASNWKELSKLTKFLIVIGLYLSSNIASFKLQENYSKTSKSILYLGTLIYGSGIFLVAQMFNYGGHFSNAFLLWGLGILPLSYLFKDKIIFIFSNILFLIYINGGFDIYDVSYWIIIIVPVLYYINAYLKNPPEGTFFNNLILLNAVGYFLDKYNLDKFYTTWIFLIIGVLMYYIPFKINNRMFNIIGSITFGICGLILTGPDVWNNLKVFKDGVTISIIFAVIYFIYLLNLTKKGNLVSLIFICITMLRYYFDTFYDFMPKSLFFIIGGVILLGFGHYFERIRNKNGGDFIEV